MYRATAGNRRQSKDAAMALGIVCVVLLLISIALAIYFGLPSDDDDGYDPAPSPPPSNPNRSSDEGLRDTPVNLGRFCETPDHWSKRNQPVDDPGSATKVGVYLTLKNRSQGAGRPQLKLRGKVSKAQGQASKPSRDFASRDFATKSLTSLKEAPVKCLEHPYAAIITDLKGGVQCTGSLIDEWHVITAASCFLFFNTSRESVQMTYTDFHPRPYSYKILLGYLSPRIPCKETFTTLAEAVFLHSLNDRHDIAIVRMNSRAPLSNTILPVCLATSVDRMPEAGCEALGFRSSSDQYQAYLLLLRTELLHTKDCDPSPAQQMLSKETGFSLANKICSELDIKEEELCRLDLGIGGPVLCVPAGVSRGGLRAARQFGITLFTMYSGCGEGEWNTTKPWPPLVVSTSVQQHQLWLNYVALPLLQRTGETRTDGRRMYACEFLYCVDWIEHMMNMDEHMNNFDSERDLNKRQAVRPDSRSDATTQLNRSVELLKSPHFASKRQAAKIGGNSIKPIASANTRPSATQLLQEERIGFFRERGSSATARPSLQLETQQKNALCRFYLGYSQCKTSNRMSRVCEGLVAELSDDMNQIFRSLYTAFRKHDLLSKRYCP
jgi:hypothetical protein